MQTLDNSDNLNAYLAAIVESSDDAIITKNLNSIIRTWNKGAEHLFGYTAEEAVGQPIMMLIPDDRQHEEVDIIDRLRRGERLQHFETIRKRKNGTLVPISLTVSPVRNASGEVIGASKIARDITQQREAAEQQSLLLAEMRHRVGNCFAVAGSLITVTARQVETPQELASRMRERLMALSSAHRLAVIDPRGQSGGGTSLQSLVHSIVEPFAGHQDHDLEIEDLRVASEALTPIALIFYELCTNATKYGAFHQDGGGLSVKAGRRGDRYVIDWHERCPLDPDAVKAEGFGTRMCDGVVRTSLGGSITRRFEPSGLAATIDLDLASLEA
ncbi:hypothetical protein OB2597_19566 [Pseudooceanicola batsensis HTCC2597]|uniref:histidine kinase n=1 Tax=Pseudooceanicola batsensis (strain ATCC BAA-863 / DSM 15984 / KCTC 12145 / HTCC2597) TaxID=252305 RepID=A3U0M3_PSEBH|nr:PAS domain S-box protein [Pseudooceanicola batsensis]EAQ02314.1 hypothetical protein OB2597_19566 [Pseudooceanicola batsensis HTCC2597]